MRRPIILTLLILATGVALAAPPAAGTGLIPRDLLFGNPVKSSPKIAPQGDHLAYLAPSAKGVMNVFVQTIGKDDATQVTNDTYRGIRAYFWAEDGKHLVYLQDVGGDENFHYYWVDLATKVVRDLTPFQGIKAQNAITDEHFPNEMLVGLNLRDRSVFDMYRIDLTNGGITLDTLNPGDVVGWFTDPKFQLRGAVASHPDGSTSLRIRDSKDAEWKTIIKWPFGDDGGPVDFTADGKKLFVTTTLGSDTSRLVLVDASDGKELETIASNSKCDVGGVIVHPDTHKLQAVGFNYLKNEWTILDDSIKPDFSAIAQVRRGEYYLVSRDKADKNWIIAFQSDDMPVAWYAWNRETKKATFLFANQPDLEKFQLPKMEPVLFKARDGVELVSYLTIPAGKEAKNLPLVLNVHGGPWARDTWGFDPESIWFADRGYATLQVNFRGSTGLGKKFLNLGDGQWGVGTMQHDLTDAVQWAIKQGIADPKKVCIYGGSYGGYATLAGLTFTPDLYTCGVDIVGPSNIKTLLASIPPYWAPLRSLFLLRIGDVDKDEALNRRISPLFHADKIKVPLIIAQGANDPRVNIREANQMVEALRGRKIPVTYIVYPDEGHGFGRPQNRLDFYGRIEEFLAQHLGGKAEPWKKVEGSSAEVR